MRRNGSLLFPWGRLEISMTSWRSSELSSAIALNVFRLSLICPQVVQKADESFEDYVNRWRSVASKMSFAIPESEAVEMVIEHMTGPLKTAVAYGNPTTFVKLFDRVARMERRTKDGDYSLIFIISAFFKASIKLSG